MENNRPVTQPEKIIKPTPSKLPWIIGGIVLVIAISAVAFFIGKQSTQPKRQDQKVCQADTKQCPDGSYVDRTGPNCEFAPCPVTQPTPTIDMSNWKTYAHSEFVVSIPSSWDIIDLKNEKDYKPNLLFAAPNLKFIPAREFPALRISLKENINPLTFEQYKSFIESPASYNINFSSHKEILLGGQKAYQSYISNNLHNPFITSFLYNNNALIEISLDLTDQMDLTIYDKILSTFKFTDSAFISVSPTSDNTNQSIRTIPYQKNSGWVDFTSTTGYSFQYPSGWQDYNVKGEQLYEDRCSFCVGNGAGGVLCANVVPYDGGSRRALVSTAGYSTQYEDVYIQGIKSLLVELGPLGDSGSGTDIIIPKGAYALIITWSNRGKDSDLMNTLLQSISIPAKLDMMKCQM